MKKESEMEREEQVEDRQKGLKRSSTGDTSRLSNATFTTSEELKKFSKSDAERF